MYVPFLYQNQQNMLELIIKKPNIFYVVYDCFLKPFEPLIKSFDLICLQPSFKAITYDLIGDDNAPIYFRIDPTFGFVTLNTGLFSDSGIQYKVCKQ